MTTRYINVFCLVNVNGFIQNLYFFYLLIHEKHVLIIVIQINKVQIFFILTYIVITTASRPTMPELISMKKRDGARDGAKNLFRVRGKLSSNVVVIASLDGEFVRLLRDNMPK